MSYSVEIINNNLLPLPDELCAELGFAVGDILVCEMDKYRSEMKMVKYMRISGSSGHSFRCEPASHFGIVRSPISV